MFQYQKKLQYPINIKKKDLRMAKYLITQFGGANGELGAAMRYFSQKFTMPDDEGKAKTEDTLKSRVRQNGVLELGMFLAKLGRDKVAILLKESTNFEKPSDIHGLIYIPFQNILAHLDLIQ